MQNCPCGSNKNHNECCAIYIEDHKNPETPEKLMRSRYTAYTQANIDYITKTMRPPALSHFDSESVRQWAARVQWSGLEVVRSAFDNTKGSVEFIAHFYEQGKKSCIHEISEFHQINDQWYYVDGKHNPSHSKSAPKIGRNDPCFCGSGKKYKICCLHQ